MAAEQSNVVLFPEAPVSEAAIQRALIAAIITSFPIKQREKIFQTLAGVQKLRPWDQSLSRAIKQVGSTF